SRPSRDHCSRELLRFYPTPFRDACPAPAYWSDRLAGGQTGCDGTNVPSRLDGSGQEKRPSCPMWTGGEMLEHLYEISDLSLISPDTPWKASGTAYGRYKCQRSDSPRAFGHVRARPCTGGTQKIPRGGFATHCWGIAGYQRGRSVLCTAPREHPSDRQGE